MGVNPKIGGKPPKMDGLFHGKPYEQMDYLGCKNPIFLEGHPYVPFEFTSGFHPSWHRFEQSQMSPWGPLLPKKIRYTPCLRRKGTKNPWDCDDSFLWKGFVFCQRQIFNAMLCNEAFPLFNSKIVKYILAKARDLSTVSRFLFPASPLGRVS